MRKGKAGREVLDASLLAIKVKFRDFVNPRKRQPEAYFPPELRMLPEEITGGFNPETNLASVAVL